MRERKPILNPKLRYEDVAFIRETYGLRTALFFPAHRMYAPPLAAPKGRAFRPIRPLRVRHLVDFPGCTQFFADTRYQKIQNFIISATKFCLSLGICLTSCLVYIATQNLPFFLQLLAMLGVFLSGGMLSAIYLRGASHPFAMRIARCWMRRVPHA